jgi:hypothetical protein
MGPTDRSRPVRPSRTTLLLRHLRPSTLTTHSGFYAVAMLRSLRDETGKPNVKTRLVALVAAIGLVVVAAPAVVPLVRWIADLIW